MTRVDFYLLDDVSTGGKDTAVCRLTHKAFQLGHRVYIHAADTEQAQRLDTLLWTFAASSFVPHALAWDADDATPVVLGQDEPPTGFDDVLITLASEVPAYFGRFRRVAEVVGGSDEDKRRARDRFRFYRDRGYALQTHNLGGERS